MSNLSLFQEYFQEVMGDMTIPFTSPIPSVWLSSFANLYEFNIYNDVVIRDGILNLLIFFKRFPNPDHLECKLYINSDYRSLVPNIWRENISFYSLVSRKTGDAKTLLITGLPTKNALGKLSAFIESAQYTHLTFILPSNQSSHTEYTYYEHNTTLQYTNNLIKFQTQTESMVGVDSITPYLEKNNLGSYAVYPLSCQLEIADNSYTHFLLSRGANLVGASLGTNKVTNYISLSPYHSYCLTDHKKNISQNLDTLLSKNNAFNYLFTTDSDIWKTLIQDDDEQYLYNQELYHLGNAFCDFI